MNEDWNTTCAANPTNAQARRLILTPLAVADADAMFAVYANERMYEFTGGSPPTSEQLHARYERLVVGWNDAHTDRWCN